MHLVGFHNISYDLRLICGCAVRVWHVDPEHKVLVVRI